MKSEDYFLISLVLFVAMMVAVFFGARQTPYYPYAELEKIVLGTFEMFCAFLSVGFFVSGIIKRIVEMRKT